MSGRLCMLNSHASALVFIVIKLQFTSSMLLQVICWCLIMFAIANVSLDLVRASPRVCQILLGKSCDLSTPKIICSKKTIHHQEFDIFDLVK